MYCTVRERQLITDYSISSGLTEGNMRSVMSSESQVGVTRLKSNVAVVLRTT